MKIESIKAINTCVMLINEFSQSNSKSSKKISRFIRKLAAAKILLELTKI